MLLQFWRGTPGTFKSPSGWLPAPGKNLVLHPRTGSGNLCSHPGLTEVSLGEEGWDYVPFLLPSLDPQVLCCPTPVPRCANWGLKVVSPSGMSQSLKHQAVLTEPVLALSHHRCLEHPGSVKALSQRRSARHGCATVILKIKMTLSFKIRLSLMC